MKVNEIITERIMDELKKGSIPWRKPWSGQGKCINYVSRKPYSVINELLLKQTGEYLTYKQIQDNKGTLKEGSKSDMVIFYKITIVKEKNEAGKEVEKRIPVLRYYNVFHISCTDLPTKTQPEREFKDVTAAEKLISDYVKKYNIQLYHNYGDKAFYSPTHDKIVVPLKKQFKDTYEYYSTLFHEAVHSTGHQSRLKRLTSLIASFGSGEYSKEELTAEIGSAVLLNKYNIETPESFRNNVAYIQSWLKALKNDSNLIVQASSKASKAVDMIEGVENNEIE